VVDFVPETLIWGVWWRSREERVAERRIIRWSGVREKRKREREREIVSMLEELRGESSGEEGIR
jgi:hypothetical protein